MMIYNTSWNDSQTKKIYKATRESEVLMDKLEFELISSGIIEMIGENPVPDSGREYGVIVYYNNAKKRKRLLSAAPRRKHNYIHVVIFSNLTREILEKNQFDLGNSRDPQPDIKIHSQEEIDKLIRLIKQYWKNFK